MLKKRRLMILLMVIIVILPLMAIHAHASSEVDKENPIDYNTQEIYSEIGIESLIDKFCDTNAGKVAGDCLDLEKDENNNNKNNKLLSVSPAKLISIVWDRLKSEIIEPAKTAMGILGIVLLAAMMEALKTCFSQKSMGEIVNSVSVLTIFVSLGYPLLECIKLGVNTIISTSDFMLGFIPIYSGVVASCGRVYTGYIYNTFLFSICQMISQIAANRLIPIIGIYMSFCLVSSITPSLNITQAANTIKSIVTWVLGFIVTAFVGLITVQGVVSASIDTAGTKTAKFLLSSSIPVVGSALSDAYTSMKGCMDVVRSSTGVVAIIFIAVSFLPVICKLVVWLISIKASAILSDFLGIKQVSDILKSSSTVVGLLLAIIVSYILLIITSTTIILILGMGLG